MIRLLEAAAYWAHLQGHWRVRRLCDVLAGHMIQARMT